MIIRDTSFEPDNVTRKAVADLFVAMFISQLLVNTAALFDSFIVGRFFKEVCLGSTSITYQLTFFNITLGSIFGVGSQLECSFALAQGDMLRANKVFSASLVQCVWGVSDSDSVSTDYGTGLWGQGHLGGLSVGKRDHRCQYYPYREITKRKM